MNSPRSLLILGFLSVYGCNTAVENGTSTKALSGELDGAIDISVDVSTAIASGADASMAIVTDTPSEGGPDGVPPVPETFESLAAQWSSYASGVAHVRCATASAALTGGHPPIVTTSTLEVLHLLKGALPPTEVLLPGGTVGSLTLSVDDGLQPLQAGAYYVLIFSIHPDGPVTLVHILESDSMGTVTVLGLSHSLSDLEAAL